MVTLPGAKQSPSVTPVITEQPEAEPQSNDYEGMAPQMFGSQEDIKVLASDAPAAPAIERPANPYEGMAQRMFGDKPAPLTANDDGAALRQSLHSVRDKSPDQYAKDLDTAAGNNLPVETVERNRDDLLFDPLNTFDIEKFTRENPKTSGWLKDPDNAAVAKDDVASLSGFEWLFKAPQKAFKQGQQTVETAELGFLQLMGDATLETQRRLDDLAAIPQNDLGDDGIFSGAVVEAARMLPFMGETLKAGAETGLQGAIGLAGGAALLGQAGPQIALPEEVITVPAAAATGFALGSRVGSASKSFELESGLAFNEFKDFKDLDGNSIDPGAIKVAAVAVGGVNASLEMLALNTLVKSFPGGEKLLNGFTSNAVKQALQNPTVSAALSKLAAKYVGVWTTEVMTEVAQEAVTIIGGQLAKEVDGDTFADLDMDEAKQRLIETAEATGKAMLLMGGVGPGGGFVADVNRVRKAKENQKTIETLGQQQSKLRDRSSARFQEFIKAAKEGGTVQDVYVPGDVVMELLQEDDLTALSENMPYLQGQLAEAQATGGDLVIPVEDYTAFIAPTPMHSTLERDIRLDPADMTMNEAEAFEADLAESSERVVAEITAEMDKVKATRSSGEQVLTDVKEQLMAAGMAPDVADQNAALIQSTFESLADRTGEDALDLYQRNRLTIRGELPEALRAPEAVENIDLVIDRVRSGKRMSDQQVMGGTLLDFVREKGIQAGTQGDMLGGVSIDQDPLIGDLIAMDIDKDLLPGQRKAIRSSKTARGMRLDDLALAAQEKGFFPGQDLEAGDRVDLSAFIEAIRDEKAGVKVRRLEENANTKELERREAADALNEELEQLGLDPKIMTNQQIKIAMGLVDEPGTEFYNARQFTLNQDEKPDNQASDQTQDYEQPDGAFALPNEGSVRRGSIQFTKDGRTIISLFKDQNLSTFAHETGHMFLETLRDVSGMTDEGSQLRDDWQTALDWMEVKDGGIKREHHEKFARGFEAYLREGKAPSIELNRVFDRFRAWLLNIYKSFSKLNVEINDDIRGVFDRLLATDEQIKIAEIQNSYLPMFDTADAAGMTVAEYKAYERAGRDATADAQSELVRKALIEETRERKAWWKEERDKLREEIAPTIETRPIYQAITAMTTGQEQPDGSKNVIKMNHAAVVGDYGAEVIKYLPRGSIDHVKGSGVHPDLIADLYGFTSGDALIDTLQNTPKMKDAIEAETDAEMKRRHGDMLNDGTIEQEAVAAIHNDKRASVIATELKVLSRRGDVRGRPAPSKVAREAAIRIIETTPIKTINVGRYRAAEVSAAKQAIKALGANDYQAAANWKRRELVNHHLVTQARKARESIDSQQKYLSDFYRRGRKFRTIDPDYVDRIRTVLGAYQFGPQLSGRKRTLLELRALNEWIEQQQADPDAGVILNIPAEILAADEKTHYSDMTVQEFRGLRDTIKNIEAQGRRKSKLLIGAADRELDAVIDEVVTSIESKPISARSARKAQNQNPDWKDKIRGGLATADAALIKTEFLIEELDGERNGVLHQALFQPFADSQAAASDLTKAVTSKVLKAMDAMPKDVRSGMTRKIEVPAMNRTFTRSDLIMMALNTGNESNLTKMVEGSNKDASPGAVAWSQQSVDAALSNLTKPEWDFVQTVWDAFEAMYPDVEAIYKRENGIAPDRIESHTVKTPFGDYRGGYFPMAYDPSRSNAGKAISDKSALEAMQGESVKASVNSSMTKARTGFAAPVLLDINSLPVHIQNTVHFVTHYEAVRGGRKLLANPRLETTIKARMGNEYYNALTDWVGAIAINGRDQVTDGPLGKFVEALRTNTTIAILGFSYTTMASQFLGYAQSLDALAKNADGTYSPGAGVKWLTGGLTQYAANPSKAITEVFGKSGEMRHRLENTDRDLRHTLNKLSGKKGGWKKMQRASLQAIGAIQLYGVDMPVWIGAYNRALAENKSDAAAILYADSIVRTSQTAGGVKDLAAIQRTRGVTTALTMFYSFFNLLYNIERQMVSDVVADKNIPKLVGRAAIILVIPAVADQLMRQNGPDEDEDPATWVALETLTYTLGSLPMVRDVASGLSSGFGYNLSPVESVGDAIGGTMRTVAKAFDEDKDMSLRDLKPLATALGVGTGAPTMQVRRMIDALDAMNKGYDVGPYDFLIGYKDD